MKLSSKILTASILLLVAGMLSSNIILKKEYDKVDKNDLYWTYHKVNQQPFKFLKIKGGNITNIAYEQSRECSVRISSDWERYHNGHVKTTVQNDTLFLDFDFTPQNTFEKYWMKTFVAVRIFSPQLLLIDGQDTNVEMYKMKQKSYTVHLSGKSKFEVESMLQDLDSLAITQRDSSEVVFEMSPEFNTGIENTNEVKVITADNSFGKISITVPGGPGRSKEAMTVGNLSANIQGNSLLDIGHAQIQSLQLNIADSSAIILSGASLKKSQQAIKSQQ